MVVAKSGHRRLQEWLLTRAFHSRVSDTSNWVSLRQLTIVTRAGGLQEQSQGQRPLYTRCNAGVALCKILKSLFHFCSVRMLVWGHVANNYVSYARNVRRIKKQLWFNHRCKDLDLVPAALTVKSLLNTKKSNLHRQSYV